MEGGGEQYVRVATGTGGARFRPPTVVLNICSSGPNRCLLAFLTVLRLIVFFALASL